MFEVGYSTPRDEPLHPFLPSFYVEARISSEFMLRLVNVEGALGLLQRASEAPLVLEVEDNEIPENTGFYTVGDSNGDVARGDRMGERVTLDVRQLAQLYAGFLPARQLVRGGLIKPGSAKAVELLKSSSRPATRGSLPDHF